jgi:hypothetical protein
MFDVNTYHTDTNLMVALDARLSEGPYPDYPATDLSEAETMTDLISRMVTHLKNCARLMNQKADAEVFATSDRSFEQLENAPEGAVLLSWEAGPPEWAINQEPLGMRLPSWAFAEAHYSFDLVVTDRRQRA